MEVLGSIETADGILANPEIGEFLVRCARPPKGIPKGPKKKKKKKITIDNDNIKTPKFSLFYCLLWYFLLGRLYK